MTVALPPAFSAATHRGATHRGATTRTSASVGAASAAGDATPTVAAGRGRRRRLAIGAGAGADAGAGERGGGGRMSGDGRYHWRRRVRAAQSGGAWWWGAAAAVVALLVLIPLSTPLFSMLTPPTEALRSLMSRSIPNAIATTVALCLAVSMTTLLFGSTTAWILTRYRFRAERWLNLLLMLPLTIPAYIHAYSLPALATRLPPFFVAWYVLSFSLAPYVFIISRVAFQRESRVLFDAAEIQGARYPFIRLALPMTRPALIGAALLVSMEVLNEYGVFVYLGVETITTLIFRLWFGHYDLKGATQLAGYVLLAIILLAMCERHSRRGIEYAQSHSALQRHARRRVQRGTTRALLQIYCLVPICCGLLIPAASLVYWSARAEWKVGEVLLASLHSVGIALLGGAICLAAGLLLAYGKRLARRPLISHLVGWAAYGYAVPGGIIAISILRVSGGAIATIGLLLLLFAYATRYLAVCYHPLHGALTQQCVCTDEIAQSLGASHFRRLWRVALPQLQRPMGAALVLILFDILKDLPLTIILRPIGLETLALKSFYYASEEQFGSAAPFALLMCLLGVVVVMTVQREQKRGVQQQR